MRIWLMIGQNPHIDLMILLMCLDDDMVCDFGLLPVRES